MIFHVLLLKKAIGAANSSTKEIKPEHELDVFDMERILDSKVNNKGKTEYLVKWLD